MNIIADTREQIVWSFPPDVKIIRGTLPTADYCLVADPYFAIERKEKNDFLGTISVGWERFLREIKRMDGWPAKIIIVECDFESFCFYEKDGEIIPPDHNHPRLTPKFICKRIAELSMMGVSVLFAGNAGYASALAYHILKEREKALKENHENKGENK
jgi:ERCC4-type nuclease